MDKKEVNSFDGLKPKVIIRLEAPNCYLQLLEYFLQDCSYLHVLQWHDVSFFMGDFKQYNETFFRDRDRAILRAKEVVNLLLEDEKNNNL